MQVAQGKGQFTQFIPAVNFPAAELQSILKEKCKKIRQN